MAEDKMARDKLVHQGCAALTDAELISVVIGEGNANYSAVELSRRIMNAAGGSLSVIARSDLKTLRMTEGLGIRKAAVLSAAFELGRRAGLEEVKAPSVIRTNEDVVGMFRPVIAGLPHEEFWVLFLSTANTVLGKEKVSQGGVSGTVVDHRLIVKRAVELLASGIILVHNHPSGIALPSGQDQTTTEKVAEAASLFDIAVLDHLIITPGECYSFRQAGIIG